MRIQKESPFAPKTIDKNKKLFRRKHGVKETILANSSKEILINVPYDDCRINKLEVIGANSLDRIDLIVLDTPTGTISTVPDYALNQFGFNVIVSDFLYSDKSDYDAAVIKDMKIKIVYYNDTPSDITVGFNIIFHEVVS